MAKRFFIILFVVSLVLAYAIYEAVTVKSRFVDSSTYIKSNSILKVLPKTKFTTFDGNKEVTLYDLSKNKNLFVHFWATWCGPCETEFPQIVKLVNSIDKDMVFVFIAVNDTTKNVQKFLNKYKFNLSKVIMLKDDDFRYKKDFGTHKLPETYVFSGDYSLLKRFVGPQKWNERPFLDYLNSLK